MKVFGNKETLSKTASDLKESLNLLPPPVNFSLPTKFIQGNANQGVFDVHVHMGQYFDDYYTPPRILRTLKLAGITHFAYSNTSNVVTDDARFICDKKTAMLQVRCKKRCCTNDEYFQKRMTQTYANYRKIKK